MENLLFWERFRPNKIEQVILLPRIEKFLKDGIKTNVLLHGNRGTGKSTLVRILTKNKNVKKINASLKNGVDILREELYEFCTSRPSPLIKTDDKMKYIYLEEFDKSTASFQEAFKSFIEEYDKGVRFIITMNHIENAIPEIRSRFNDVCFDPKDEYEKEFLKKGYFKYLKSVNIYLEKKYDFKIDDKITEKIINKNFPDLRKSVQDIQQIYISNDFDLFKDDKHNIDIYKFIMNGNNDVNENFDFVDEFKNEPNSLLKSLGRPFIKYLIENHTEIFKQKGFTIIKSSKEHAENFDNMMIDPVVHLTNFINELKKIITN